ncbi:MAG TPA: hypothetical protein VN256_16845 [Pyrinomonadaceae bacterium]|nr:hypothetical protein [Pyrinomonadaceae bacterium]
MSKQPQKRPEEYLKFKALTEKLIAVPKGEIDEKKAAYDNKKKEKPAK